jgi:putative aldouronate transport system permease protein
MYDDVQVNYSIDLVKSSKQRGCEVKTVALKPVSKKSKTASYFKRYWTLYLLLALPIAYFIIFKYIPMSYIQIAFKKYSIVQSVWDMPWANNYGFEYFIKAFSNRDFIYALRNTITLNLLDLLVGFPAPIILALILNELTFKRFKRITQTIAYMPHFLSWIIIAGMGLQLFAPTTGLVNNVLGKLGLEPVGFLNDPNQWVWYYVLLGVWQSVGWNTIIYLAAITGINPELYEAASMDGAGRLRKMWHITLPGLRPTIIVLLILSLGRILGSEFDRPYALSNNLVKSVANVISTFVYTNGIRGLQFSLTTAVGLFQSVVGVIFVLSANAIAKRFGERGIM